MAGRTTPSTPENNPLGATNDGSAKEVATASAPSAPEESPRASITARPQYPVNSFVVEGVPEITSEGTKLTKTQLKTVLEQAEVMGVGISHDGQEEEGAN